MENMEDKLMQVLEYYLSLHEADEIFSMLFDDKYSNDDIVDKLDFYKNNEE